MKLKDAILLIVLANLIGVGVILYLVFVNRRVRGDMPNKWHLSSLSEFIFY
jgi:hypothetical protein